MMSEAKGEVVAGADYMRTSSGKSRACSQPSTARSHWSILFFGCTLLSDRPNIRQISCRLWRRRSHLSLVLVLFEHISSL